MKYRNVKTGQTFLVNHKTETGYCIYYMVGGEADVKLHEPLCKQQVVKTWMVEEEPPKNAKVISV